MLIHKQNEFGAVTRTVEKTGDYTVFRGRWFKAFAEPIRGDVREHFWPDCPAIWYLSDHGDAGRWGLCAPLQVLALPGVTSPEDGRVMPGDVGCARTGYDAEDAAEYALAQLERRATLAWIAGRIPSPWPKTTAPGYYAADLQPGFAGAYAAVNARALADAARAAVHRDVRIEPTRRLCDCQRMPGWGTACVHVRARLAELAEGGDESEAR